MAYLKPIILIPVTMHWGVVGTGGLAATQKATMPIQGVPYAIEVWVEDANDTFTATTVTTTAGSTVVDATAVSADTPYTYVDQDSLSSTAVIDQGTALKLTVADVGTDADGAFRVTLWVYPTSA